MTETTPKPTSRRSQSIQKKVYNDFISCLELRRIWLDFQHLINHHGPDKPDGLDIKVTTRFGWVVTEDGFTAQANYEVRFVGDDDDILLEIAAIYSADFQCEEVPEDRYLEAFAGRNLQVILWPYLRQLVQDLVSRAGWDALVLPTYKVP